MAPGWGECRRGGSNPYTFRYRILSPARLPIPPLLRWLIVTAPYLSSVGIATPWAGCPRRAPLTKCSPRRHGAHGEEETTGEFPHSFVTSVSPWWAFC